jgi:hypothetical protein
MATNFFFNNFQNSLEQGLIEDLMIESISIYGLETIYVPRNPNSIDAVLGEDPGREYIHAIPVEMYVKNVEGFSGQGDFLSKFNIQIRDQITFTIARRTFANEVGMIEGIVRPLEGDLVYFPLNKKMFEVKFVEHESIFYQMGSLQVWDLQCELFEYNNEYIDTGTGEIDALMANYSNSTDMFSVLTENGLEITTEESYPFLQERYDINENDPLATNDEIQVESDEYIDFTERDPFSEGAY